MRATVTGGKTSPREVFEPTVEDLLISVRGNRKRKYQSKQFRQQTQNKLASTQEGHIKQGPPQNRMVDKCTDTQLTARQSAQKPPRRVENPADDDSNHVPPSPDEGDRAAVRDDGDGRSKAEGETRKKAEKADKWEKKKGGAGEREDQFQEEQTRLQLLEQASLRTGIDPSVHCLPSPIPDCPSSAASIHTRCILFASLLAVDFIS